MRRNVILIGLLFVFVMSSCTYIPIPLPQKYKLASEEYVNTQVTTAMSEEMGGMVDSMRMEMQGLIGDAMDSMLVAQQNIKTMVAENQKLQSELQAAISDQSATVEEHSKKLAEIDKLTADINTLQAEIVKNMENMPMMTLMTLQKALATYRPRPLEIKKPVSEPAKIPAPVITKAKTPEPAVEDEVVMPADDPEEMMPESDGMMDADSTADGGN